MEEDNITTSPEGFVTSQSEQLPLPWNERNGFPHWVMGIIWVVVAFIGFNVVGAIAGAIAAITVAEDLTDPVAIISSISENVDILFLVNTIGQVTVMALGTLLIVKLSAIKGQRTEFLRLKLTKNVWVVTALSVLLVVLAYPTVIFLGWLNSFVPAPAWMMEVQQSMADLITKFLKSDNALLLGLFHIGIIPSVCEEIMYRGYVMRSLEKSKGVIFAIFVSGIIFGAYHMQITNILPLAALGILFAYVTYISDSIIPAMFAHFANNGGQVIMSSFYPEMLDETVTPDTEMPFLLIFISMILTSGLLFFMHKMKKQPEQET